MLPTTGTERPAPRATLVVGSSSPIGRAVVAALVAEDHRVVGVSLEPAEDDALSLSLAADCADPTAATAAVQTAVDHLGRLDVVVLAAAAMPVAAAHRTDDLQWRTALGATLDAAFWTVRAALPHLGAGSAVVAVSSVNATVAAPGLPGYAAAKAGVEGLVRQLALEYGPRGIRVNAVAPGMIGGEHLPAVTEGYPLGRVGTPAEVGQAVAFLASDRASFVTGAVLPVDGGLSISSPAAWARPDLRARFLEP